MALGNVRMENKWLQDSRNTAQKPRYIWLFGTCSHLITFVKKGIRCVKQSVVMILSNIAKKKIA